MSCQSLLHLVYSARESVDEPDGEPDDASSEEESSDESLSLVGGFSLGLSRASQKSPPRGQQPRCSQ